MTYLSRPVFSLCNERIHIDKNKHFSINTMPAQKPSGGKKSYGSWVDNRSKACQKDKLRLLSLPVPVGYRNGSGNEGNLPFLGERGTSLFALLYSVVLWLKKVDIYWNHQSKVSRSELCSRTLPLPWNVNWGWPRKAFWSCNPSIPTFSQLNF